MSYIGLKTAISVGCRRFMIPTPKVHLHTFPKVLSPIINPTFSRYNQFSTLQDHHSHKRPGVINIRQQLYKTHVQVRNAQFWKVVTNLRLVKRVFKDQYQGKGGHKFRVRVVWVALTFIGLNIFFNIMMVILTNMYFDEIQKIPWSFGFWTSTEYKKGVANDEIMKNERLANQSYLKTLKMVYEDKTKNPANGDSFDCILPNEVLQEMANSKEFEYLSSYFDLLMRYGLTSTNTDNSCLFITKALNLIDEYQSNYRIEFGSYKLKCSSLRFLAEYLKTKGHNDPRTFGKIEDYFLKIIQLVISHEDPDRNFQKLLVLNEDNDEDNTGKLSYELAIIPQHTVASQLMIESVLDLCVFYISTGSRDYINKSLSLLLSLMRSVEFEMEILDNITNKTYSSQVKLLKDKRSERVTQLQYEIIPLVQSHTSEVLWYFGNHSRAIELAKEATYKATLNCKDDASSAKIAKMGFKNLSLMYSEVGDELGAEVCREKYDEIEVPIEGFMGNLNEKGIQPVRKAVLYRYFGDYGTILFP